jgi:hypothetical protein
MTACTKYPLSAPPTHYAVAPSNNANATSQAFEEKRPTDENERVARAPKKNMKLHAVEDDNFDPSYMYPDTASKKRKKTAQNVSTGTSPALHVTKEECVGMLGEAKFARYVEMLGSEAAALKRCAMLKAID